MIFASEQKQRSRVDTVIGPYRERFGYCLPPEKQYWTLSANCCGGARQLIPESEFAQVLDAGLITHHQFHGVDSDCDIIDANDTLGLGNFHYGDIYQVMSNYKDFNSGVVNLDLLCTFRTELSLIKRIFFLLSSHTDVLFNINILSESHHVKFRDPKEMYNTITSDPDFVHGFREYGWSTVTRFYAYKGMGPRTLMTSLTLTR